MKVYSQEWPLSYVSRYPLECISTPEIWTTLMKAHIEGFALYNKVDFSTTIGR